MLKGISLILVVLSAGFACAQAASSPTPVANPDGWLAEVVNENGAPVKITEFFDYQCPFCAATIPALEDALRSYPGKVQLILRNSPLSIHPDSMLAHQAALAAGEQGKFWEMYRLLYANQKRLKPANLLEYARQLNLDLDLFQRRLQSGFYEKAVQQDIALAGSLGVNGTPTFFINGQKLVGAQTSQRLKQAIDNVLNPKAVAALPPTAPPLSAKELDLSYSPVRGPRTAPVTIIEFSDMQCPYCASVAPTLRELLNEHPGNIKWVFKNFPLPFHKDSPLAHRAVMAAANQGKFWEMHDLIFGNQHAIKRDDLMAKASSLGLDMTLFVTDLDSDKTRRLVEADVDEGTRMRVNGTPTFFINGKEYSGALSASRFKAIVDKELSGGAADTAAATSTVGSEITLGPLDAPVTLTWYSDLQSELALRATLQIRQLMSAHPGKIRLVFKNRPLEIHPGAMRLHEAALAANAQGKFWQMHDLIIANSHKDDEGTLLSYAVRIGLDTKRFQSELESHKYKPHVEEQINEAKRLAVLGTPVFFINSTRIDGLQPQATLERLVSEQLTNKVQASSRH